MPKLLVGFAEGKGRCVYAGEKILKGQSIDTNCVILFPNHHVADLCPPLQNYPFAWDEKYSCIALGSVSLANHDMDNPNAVTQRDFDRLLIRLVAKRDIEPGEEITYDYKVPLWFEPQPPSRLSVPASPGGQGCLSGDGQQASLGETQNGTSGKPAPR